ncbi:hypothetical protein GCM10020000_24720 [Streptomyces olivoverticillatus]
MAGEAAVGAYGADAADAQQHLLQQAVFAAAAVEPVGDVAFAGAVVLHVGVEEQQRHPSDLGLPDVCEQRAAAGQREGDPAGGVPSSSRSRVSGSSLGSRRG